MDLLRRQLLLPASEIFSSCNRSHESLEAVALESGRRIAAFDDIDDWKIFLVHCEALLKSGEFQAPHRVIEQVATQIAKFGSKCYRAGLNEGIRQSTTLNAEKARIAKRERANERGYIVRQAIVAVCTEQSITLVASQKFAASIQAAVIETAGQLGLLDARKGTSPRSLQRHIEALIEASRMRNPAF